MFGNNLIAFVVTLLGSFALGAGSCYVWWRWRQRADRHPRWLSKSFSFLPSESPITFVYIDAQMQILMMDGQGLKGFAQFLGRSLHELIDAPDLLTLVREALEGKSAWTMIHVDGRDHEIWIQPVFEDETTVVGVKLLGIDITSRRRMLKEQNRLTRQLRTVAELMSQRNFSLDPQELLDDVAVVILHMFDGQCVSIYLLNQRQEMLVRRAVARVEGVLPDEGMEMVSLHDPQSVAARAMCEQVMVVEKGEVALPFIIQKTAVGVLHVRAMPDRHFSAADVDTLTMIANYVAFNLEGCQLFEDSQNTLRELDALNKITVAINSTVHLSEVLDMTTQKIVATIEPVTHCSIGLLNDDLSELRIVAEYPKQDDPALVFKVSEAATVQRQIDHRQTLVIDSVHTDSSLAPIREYLAQFGIYSALFVPIIAKGELIGSLGLDVSEYNHVFSASEIDLAEVIATQVAIAIERTHLFQEAQVARQEAEAASRAKSTFLANMSHELRTPLNAIIGYSEMLMEEVKMYDMPDLVGDLERVHISGTSLLELISDILDFSKLDIGDVSLHLETFAIDELLQALVATFQPRLLKRGNVLEVSIAPEIGELHADRSKVKRVLSNLLDNARKFTEQGTLTLEAGRHLINGAEWVCFKVSDTGIGMTAEQLTHLFQPFTQADMSRTRQYDGTGLGLTISQRFCQLMGGRIDVESNLGEGSTFSVWLPAVVTAAPAIKREILLPPTKLTPLVDERHQGQQIVLIIDDDPMARNLLMRYFAEEGYEIETAATGQQGLDKAVTLQPSLITLDLFLPDISGWKILETLKEDKALAAIPIMLISIADDEQRGYDLGADGYFQKPITRGQFQYHYGQLQSKIANQHLEA